MKEIKLTPEELKVAIDFGKLIGSGFFSKVFTYKGKLIKMDENLYQILKKNNYTTSENIIKEYYRLDKNDFNDREQLEELEKRQPYIRPKVPEGIITIKSDDSRINGISPGIIIPYFKGYKDFSKIPKTEYKQLLIFFKKIFDDIKSLADNEIAQKDLFRNHVKNNKPGYNIIQKDKDAQIIDMSGQFVTVGKEFNGPELMYSDFANMINYYYQANKLEPVYQEDYDITEDKLAEMITEFSKQTRKK